MPLHRRKRISDWAELASINEMAGGRPISQLGHGERLGMALRLVGGRYYNMVSGIKWPGWGGLARALLDPRTMLTGAVGGLNMILNAGSNLFSAGKRWRQDPLGNLLKSSADIATGLAIILGSITALAGLVAAIMGCVDLNYLRLRRASRVTCDRCLHNHHHDCGWLDNCRRENRTGPTGALSDQELDRRRNGADCVRLAARGWRIYSPTSTVASPPP